LFRRPKPNPSFSAERKKPEFSFTLVCETYYSYISVLFAGKFCRLKNTFGLGVTPVVRGTSFSVTTHENVLCN
jgi:hypothetical protein